MTPLPEFEFTEEQERQLRRAKRVTWLSLAYLLSVIGLLSLFLGSSQIVTTAWWEAVLSLIPPAIFLIAAELSWRAPDPHYPYGYHRVVSIAFLCAAFALFTMGLFLLGEAIWKLVGGEHPTIGAMLLFGWPVWSGWLLVPVFLWSALPAVWLGHVKLPLARALHDKVLYADARMNKADWLTALAAIAGLLGIAWGLWWADAVAAGAIALDIGHDGWRQLRAAVTALANRMPRTVDGGDDPLPGRVHAALAELAWARAVEVRLREEGHLVFGEAFVVPRSNERLTERVHEAMARLRALDWRLRDVVVVPVLEADEPHKVRAEPPRGGAAVPRA